MSQDSGSAALFGCNTYAYMQSESAETCLRRLAGYGFREFELMVHPGHLWPGEVSREQRRALRHLFERDHLQLTTVNLPNIDINIASTTPEMRAYSFDLLAKTVRLAGELGAQGVVMSPGKASQLAPAGGEQLLGYFLAALDRLSPIAADSGTALWIENVPVSFIPSADGLMDALSRHGDDSVRIVYDIPNAYFIAEDFVEGIKRCGERLALLHLSDTGRQIYRHDPIGAGSVPFADVLPALVEIGYRARPMLEIISADTDRDILASADRLAALGFDGGTQARSGQ